MKKLAVTAAALILGAAVIALSQSQSVAKHHTIFQLSEPEGNAWNALEVHVQSLQNTLGKDGGAEIEVVFFGAGLNMLKKTNTAHEAKLKALADSGVHLMACQNAMRLMNVKTEDLFPFAGQVDSAVAELTRKQEAHWAYVH